MSTKNLARTAIEGGRYNRNKWERRYSNSSERAKIRAFLHNSKIDIDYFDKNPEPVRESVHKEFKDRLSAPNHWMEKQAGKHWDGVRSELFLKFDRRTTAGRHIVFDHLLQIERYSNPTYFGHKRSYFLGGRKELVIGEDGILWINDYGKNNSHKGNGKRTKTEKQLKDWVGDRRIEKVGTKMFWFQITTKKKVNLHFSRNLSGKPYYNKKDDLEDVKFSAPEYSDFFFPYQVLGRTWRQHRSLSKEELEYFSGLNDYEKNLVTIKRD